MLLGYFALFNRHSSMGYPSCDGHLGKNDKHHGKCSSSLCDHLPEIICGNCEEVVLAISFVDEPQDAGLDLLILKPLLMVSIPACLDQKAVIVGSPPPKI